MGSFKVPGALSVFLEDSLMLLEGFFEGSVGSLQGFRL